MRRWLEEEAAENLPSRVGAKMLKDIRDSLVRKADRGLPFLQLIRRSARTAVLANALGFLAEVIVSQVVLCFRWFRANQLLEREQVRLEIMYKGHVPKLCICGARQNLEDEREYWEYSYPAEPRLRSSWSGCWRTARAAAVTQGGFPGLARPPDRRDVHLCGLERSSRKLSDWDFR
jgi:hypothetical protein